MTSPPWSVSLAMLRYDEHAFSSPVSNREQQHYTIVNYTIDVTWSRALGVYLQVAIHGTCFSPVRSCVHWQNMQINYSK